MSEKLKQLADRIKDSVENLITLEIITAVGEVMVETSSDSKKQDFIVMIPTDKKAKAIYTQIDLLQGDIKTMFHQDFITGDYKELRVFHKTRESQGHEIIRQNIALLQKVFEYVKSLMEG